MIQILCKDSNFSFTEYDNNLARFRFQMFTTSNPRTISEALYHLLLTYCQHVCIEILSVGPSLNFTAQTPLAVEIILTRMFCHNGIS
jgi:hypothetical protein